MSYHITTGGPWQAVLGTSGNSAVLWAHGGRRMIAVFPAASMLPEHIVEANANAVLASAAKDMLSIMPDIMAMLDDPENKHEMEPHKKEVLRTINDLCESFRVK